MRRMWRAEEERRGSSLQSGLLLDNFTPRQIHIRKIPPETRVQVYIITERVDFLMKRNETCNVLNRQRSQFSKLVQLPFVFCLVVILVSLFARLFSNV